MKTLTSFRTTTRNPAFKLFSRLFAVFGLVMIFAVSGWAAKPIISDANKSIAENSPGGTNVGTALTATNSPTGFTITGGTGAALFDISSTGQITVHAGAVLDYETTPTYTLQVKATNTGGDGNIATITVNLTDVLVPIVTAGQSFSLLTGTANGTVVGTVATTVTTPSDFNITGTTFAINSSGQITVANSAGLVAGTGTYTVGASTSEGGDSKPITIVVTQRSSNLGLTNTDSVDPVITNASYSYTLSVSNAGPHDATELVLTDTLPVGVTYQSAVGTGWTCTQADGVVDCNKSSLANGASSNVVITVLAPVLGGVITNTATVISSGIDVNPANNTDIEQSTTVQAKADLMIVKTGPASAIVNNTIQYTLSVTNLGPSATSDVNVTDVLPTGLGYQIYSGNDWICSYTTATRTFSCTHPTTLEIGATSAIILVTTAPSAVPSPANVVNTATVTGPLIDPDNSNNSSSKTTTITAASYANANVRPFALFRQDNVNGDVQMIGNSVMETSTGACAPVATNNNNLNTRYADKDSDAATTLNSTSADLVLPPKVRSGDILYAMLYWQGRTTATNQIVNGKTVKIKPFGLANYQTVTSLDTKFNWTANDYQGAVEVTDLIKNSLDAVGNATLDSTGYNKPLWVGDVFANQLGNNSNGFGAWSLIIAYKDSAAKLRNISTYDGYDAVYNNTKQATLSGFLTPSSGAVDSKFLVFAGEGDVSLTDSVTLTNASGSDVSLGSNIFKSSEDINGVNVTNRNPNCQNTIGADIRTFNVGTTGSPAIIGNSQQTTTVKLTSTGDQYMPGAFAFSTQLYLPSVCYAESVMYNNALVSESNKPVSGNKVDYIVTVRNQDAEDAKGVFVEKVFDTPNQISYGTNSLQIAPIPGTTFSAKTDRVGDDTAEYSGATTTAKFLLGAGAAWYQGGTIKQNEETKFKYKAKIGDQNVMDSGYKMSYRNDLLHLTFNGISAPKCSDFNNSYSIIIPDGVYDAWETTIVGAPPIKDDRKIYTKIVNSPVTLKVGAMNGANTAYQNYSSGLIGWRVVNSSTCPGGDENVTGWTDISLATINPSTISFTPTQANKDVMIQFSHKQQDGTYSALNRNCSSDDFAIRPDHFEFISVPVALMKAGEDYNLSVNAFDFIGGNTAGYDQVVSTLTGAPKSWWNRDTGAQIPTANLNTEGNTTIAGGWSFVNGAGSVQIRFSDVGKFTLDLNDTNWAAVDIGNNPAGDANTIIHGEGNVTFIPYDFNITAGAIVNNDGASPSFTYLSSDLNMSARIPMSIAAQNKQGNTTQNYANNLYERNITITPSVSWPMVTIPNPTVIPKTLGVNNADANFTSGTTSMVYNDTLISRFNFDRNQTMPISPFDVNSSNNVGGVVNDVNVSVIDTDLVYGDKNETLSGNATFVYGRVIPRDIRVFGAGTAFTANAWYEVYNAPNIGGVLPASKIESMWYINIRHSDNPAVSYDGDANVTYVNTTSTNIGGAVGNDGMEDYAFGTSYSLGGYKAHINTDSWLWYGANALTYHDPDGTHLDCQTHPCFNISIVPPIGATGSAKSTNEATKGSKKSSEGSGAWKSTSDYAPAIR